MIYGLGEKNKKYHMVWREMNNVYILKCYNYYYSDVYNKWYNNSVVNSYATTKYETWGHITQVRSNMILVQRFPEKRKFGTFCGPLFRWWFKFIWHHLPPTLPVSTNVRVLPWNQTLEFPDKIIILRFHQILGVVEIDLSDLIVLRQSVSVTIVTSLEIDLILERTRSLHSL